MPHLRTAIATAVATVATLGAVSAPAQAAPKSCPKNNVCLYDGVNFTGAWNRHSCSRKSIPFVQTGSSAKQVFKSFFSNSDPTNTDRQDAKFFKRVESVYNRCGHSWVLWIAPRPNTSRIGIDANAHIKNLPIGNMNYWLTDPARVRTR